GCAERWLARPLRCLLSGVASDRQRLVRADHASKRVCTGSPSPQQSPRRCVSVLAERRYLWRMDFRRGNPYDHFGLCRLAPAIFVWCVGIYVMNARELIAEISRRTVSGDDTTLLQNVDGWDSLKGVQLVLKIEQVIGRHLTENELERLESIQDVDALLKVGR